MISVHLFHDINIEFEDWKMQNDHAPSSFRNGVLHKLKIVVDLENVYQN